jgi:mannose-6-phosphate isomerase-like protein (cupin superfamily)
MKVEDVRESWRLRDFSCDEWVDPPGKRWEGYVHEVDELLMVVEGHLELEMGGKKLRLALGEEVFIPAREVHSVRNVGGTVSRWLYGYKRVRRDPDACL